MKKISFNQGTLTIDQNQITYEVPLQKVLVNSAQELEAIFQHQGMSFPCDVQLSSDMLSMVFSYQVGSEFVPFLQSRLFDRSIRLSIVDQLVRLGYYFDTQNQLATVFQPVNFFIDSQGHIKMLYQGLKGLMPAEGYEEEPLFDQVRRLVLMLFSEARFDELRINGLKSGYQKAFSGERPWIKQILQADDLNHLLTLISNEKGGLALPSHNQEQSVFMTEQPRDDEHDREQELLEPSLGPYPGLLPRPSSLQDTQPPSQEEPIEKVEMIKPPIQPTKQTSLLMKGNEESLATKIVRAVNGLRGNPMAFTFTLVSIGSVLFVAILYFMMQSSIQADADTEKLDAMTKGLHLAAIQQYKEAAKHFEQMDFTKLSKEEQQAVIFSYLRAEEFDKILEINPQYLDVIITYLERIDQIEKIHKISVDTPEVKFAQAAEMKDMVGMEEVKDQVKMDLRRKKKLIDGYFFHDQPEQARIYAEKSNDSRLIQYYRDKLPISGVKP